MAEQPRSSRGIFAGLGVIVLAVIVTVAAFALILNTRCSNGFWGDQDVYPGAELVESQSTFLGLQRAVYHSDDSPDEIDNWYRSQQAAQMRAAVESGDFSAAEQRTPSWTVTADTENGGSLITRAAVCPGGSPPL